MQDFVDQGGARRGVFFTAHRTKRTDTWRCGAGAAAPTVSAVSYRVLVGPRCVAAGGERALADCRNSDCQSVVQPTASRCYGGNRPAEKSRAQAGQTSVATGLREHPRGMAGRFAGDPNQARRAVSPA